METDWWTSADVGGLTMDAYDIPTDWPRIKKVYNDNSLRRQIIEFYRYGPSGEEIKWKMNRTGFLPPQE